MSPTAGLHGLAEGIAYAPSLDVKQGAAAACTFMKFFALECWAPNHAPFGEHLFKDWLVHHVRGEGICATAPDKDAAEVSDITADALSSA